MFQSFIKIALQLALVFVFILSSDPVGAQTYTTRTAHINVRSENKLQTIVANNYQSACQLNAQTGLIKISCLIKSFDYQIGAINSAMNSHNIDLSDYPKITYEGTITNLKQVNFSKAGSYPIKIKGMLYIWDEKRETSADGILTVLKDGSIEGKSNFNIEIEEASLEKIDKIMLEFLPKAFNLQANSFGISKNIRVKADLILKKD